MIWLNTIVQGVLLGGLYTLFALGLSLSFGVMRLVNLAHGDLILAGSYLILAITVSAGVSPWLALLAALPIMSCEWRNRFGLKKRLLSMHGRGQQLK
jgi:branched-chain amino acid transport system permease protein